MDDERPGPPPRGVRVSPDLLAVYSIGGERVELSAPVRAILLHGQVVIALCLPADGGACARNVVAVDDAGERWSLASPMRDGESEPWTAAALLDGTLTLVGARGSSAAYRPRDGRPAAAEDRRATASAEAAVVGA